MYNLTDTYSIKKAFILVNENNISNIVESTLKESPYKYINTDMFTIEEKVIEEKVIEEKVKIQKIKKPLEEFFLYLNSNIGKIMAMIGFLGTFIIYLTTHKGSVLFVGIMISIISGGTIGSSNLFFLANKETFLATEKLDRNRMGEITSRIKKMEVTIKEEKN